MYASSTPKYFRRANHHDVVPHKVLQHHWLFSSSRYVHTVYISPLQSINNKQDHSLPRFTRFIHTDSTMSAAASGYTIHVVGLAPETTEEKLHDFFSFCGKLVSVQKSGSTADITFEKLSAMRTSLMLNGGTVSPSQSAHKNLVPNIFY